MSDDHSKLAPLLPISNRTVKRLSADDSVDYPCESRSSSDSLQIRKPSLVLGFFIGLGILVVTYCNEVTRAPQALVAASANIRFLNVKHQRGGLGKVGHRQTERVNITISPECTLIDSKNGSRPLEISCQPSRQLTLAALP